MSSYVFREKVRKKSIFFVLNHTKNVFRKTFASTNFEALVKDSLNWRKNYSNMN